MTRNLWSGVVGVLVALLALLAIAYGLLLIGLSLPVALLFGWLMSGIIGLAIGGWQQASDWAALGFIALGGALVSLLIWQGIPNWWWPLGLVALGVAYVPLAALLPGRLAAGWSTALEISAPFVAGVGAVWEVGQVILAFIFASQGAPLLADDTGALNASFVLSSLLLVGGSLLWALLHRRLIGLALTALLAGQLAVALVINTTAIGDPSLAGLLALALLVVALACHAGTYPLRLMLPGLAPGASSPFWRLLMQRRGWRRAILALKTRHNAEAWWLCLLLDSFALLLCLLAAMPVASLSAVGTLDGPPLLIILSAGLLLSIAIAYWQNTPWLLLLAGLFLAVDLYMLGVLASNPPLAWPLLYLACTIVLLGIALTLKHCAGRRWGSASLLVVLLCGGLSLHFAFQRASLGWELGVALVLAGAVAGAFWGWRRRAPATQRP